MIFIDRNLLRDLTFLYIVSSAARNHSPSLLASVEEKIAAALAPAEPRAAPIASELFPNARMSMSPFAVPSCCFTVARASTSIAFNPARLASSAWSSGWHVLRPCLQSDTRCGATPSVLASLVSFPPMPLAARVSSSLRSSSWVSVCCMLYPN